MAKNFQACHIWKEAMNAKNQNDASKTQKHANGKPEL